MPWRKGTAFRTDPGVGQRIRVNTFLDPIDSATVVQETLLFAGAPANFLHAAHLETLVWRPYPYSGVGSVGGVVKFALNAGVGSLFLQLSSLAMDTGDATRSGSGALDPAGFALVVLTGSARGEVRRITGWHTNPTSQNKQVDIDRQLPWAVNTADAYALGFLCEHDTELLLHTRFSQPYSAAPSAQVTVCYTDLSYTDSGAVRAPVRYIDRVLDVYNTGLIFDGDSLYQGQLLSVPCKGGVVATTIITAAPASGGLSVWMTSI